MALFTPSQSPAVVVKEIDLTGGVPNVQSTTGAFVGNFRWGPAEQRVLVANEQGLIEVFATPDANNNRDIDFVSASQFLRYSNSLQVVRIVDTTAKNSRFIGGQSTDGTTPIPTVKNKLDFDASISTLDSDLQVFVARYPGELGDEIRVSVWDSSSISGWAYASSFDAAPGTSTFGTNNSITNDEMHIAVVDVGGKLSGTAGTVLETFPFVSKVTDAKNIDGTNNYAVDVVNERSQYVHMVNFDSDFQVAGAGAAAIGSTDYSRTTRTQTNYDLTGGVNSGTLSASNIQTGFDLFEDKDIVEVDFLIAPSMVTTADQTTIVNDLVSTASSTRKDCIVVASPARDDIVNLTSGSSITTNIVETANTFTKSSYLIQDGNFLKVYDKFNDQYIQIPAASSTAGLMAATDRNAAPWFSPAGGRRGQYLGVTAIDYTPTKSQRDTLYKAGVNPIANIPGQGIILFGDKTNLGRPSAFDRINVRRLFLVLERAISRAAENVLFEFNDEFTRAEFVNIVEPVLREVKGRRGITDFRVVCDETNNTAAVVDRNEFIASIFIKPARSINFVTLNFVAVRSGVDFEEVVGTV
jgi:hypothetical protein